MDSSTTKGCPRQDPPAADPPGLGWGRQGPPEPCVLLPQGEAERLARSALVLEEVERALAGQGRGDAAWQALGLPDKVRSLVSALEQFRVAALRGTILEARLAELERRVAVLNNVVGV